MSLIKSYIFSDSLFVNIGYSHGIDPHTRLRMRIGRMTDIVQRTYAPVLKWDLVEQDLVWFFPVERRPPAKWDDVSLKVQLAAFDFFGTCSLR